MSFACGLSAASVFIDLAAFSGVDTFIYGGPAAVTKFVTLVQKSNLFGFLPLPMRVCGCEFDFGIRHASATLSRSADYIMHVWFRAQIPLIELAQPATGTPLYTDATLRWTRNLMHNIFEAVSITFNELEVECFDSIWLDYNFQLRCRGSKRIGYRAMIGDIAAMTTPVAPDVPLGTGGYFSVPLPFWFTEDSGIALPIAALPFNDVKVNMHFRRWQELVVVYPGTAAMGGPGRVATTGDVFIFGTSNPPAMQDAQLWTHHAVVHNDERIKMGDAPRDMLITQIQSTHGCFKDISSETCFDLRLSHSIILFVYGAQNYTIQDWNGGAQGAEWSNYTTEIDYAGLDPIAFTRLVYENTLRVANGSDYFSLIQPDLLFDAIPDETGYHVYSYAYEPFAFNTASGSTNYSKLANVSLHHTMSPAALAAAGINTASGSPEDQNGNIIQWPNSSGVLTDMPQKFRHILRARNWNIARVVAGSLGTPTS